MTTAIAMAPEPKSDDLPVTTRRFIKDHETPEGALCWSSRKEKAHNLRAWRKGVSIRFSDAARALRVAWALEGLFGTDGYAFPSDTFLAHDLELPEKKIQAALLDLEQAGAIIRRSVYVRSKPQRRVWPATKIAVSYLPTMGGMPPPHNGAKYPPVKGGHNTYERTSARDLRLSSTVQQARKAAEIRERRALERASEGGSDE